MTVAHQVVAALLLDLVFGDPRWLPHPVRLLGGLATALEAPTRRVLPPRIAGIVTALVVLSVTGGGTYALLMGAAKIHPWLAGVFGTLLLYTCIAARDLAKHANEVLRSLCASDIPRARQRVGWMVGRDTDRLDEPEIVRAAVESIAENTVDGVTAPLFYGCLFGPVGAIVYKAINTLDSTFGYKNERYLRFGWASARIDDVANFVPARLTAPLVALAASLLRLRAASALAVWLRDGRKHPSPNSGLTEAAMAGALGVQLGGLNYYAGQPSPKPTLGDPLVPLNRKHIRSASVLMLITTLLATAAFLGVRWAITLAVRGLHVQ